MSRLHSSHTGASAPSTLLPPAYDGCAQDTSEDRAVRRSSSEAFKLNDLKSADFQFVNEGGRYNQHINDHLSNHGAHKDYDRNNQAFHTGSMVFKEMIIQTHLLPTDGNEERLADRQTDARNADPESKNAEKARICEVGFTDQSALADNEAGKASSFSSRVQQGNTVAHSFHDQLANIDTLLSDEDSIFARVQSRPLPSARFTHKKTANLSGLDRPLSPLKMSRPILKRGDTLDATWKAICESKRHSSPLHRHHSNHTSKAESLEVTIDTIGKVSSSSYLSPTKQRSKIMMASVHNGEKHLQANPIYRREPSMPQEELNAKVESFISRFNEQIRIQREKSLRDYMEMVG